ncbi:MAG: hypothetical protein WAM60_21055 [Candidatus Promineifilaceae bacterium]
MLGTAGLIAGFMYFTSPNFSVIAWLILFISIAAILYQPRYGIYIILFWTMAGDHTMMDWYPFIKNFSSRETLLFLNDAVIFSPLELLLVLTSLTWLLRGLFQRNLEFHKGPLFFPLAAFIAFIAFGLVYGIGRGGNTNVALWESRAMFYMFLLVVLVSNLLKNKEHIKAVMWVAVAGLFVKGAYGVWYLVFFLHGGLEQCCFYDGSSRRRSSWFGGCPGRRRLAL